MFRSDRDALAGEVADLRAENERLRAQNDVMRVDLLARRAVERTPSTLTSTYSAGVAGLTPGERAALIKHDLKPFPVWAVVVLHFLTFGLFTLVHFNLMHDRLPKAERNDPSALRGVGFFFIPYFNFYWLFFSSLRLCDRLNLQFQLRGMPDGISRNLVLAASILTFVPYFNVVAPFVWGAAALLAQHAVNKLAEEDDLQRAAPVDASRVRIPAVRDPLPFDVAGQGAAEDAAAEAVVEESRSVG